MAESLTDVAEDDLERAQNELKVSFEAVFKSRQADGRWTVTGYNLALGVNQAFRALVVAAAERIGIDPAAVAALIDIEAAKSASGEWDPNSANPSSSARGLTQFVKATWLEMATRAGTFLAAAVSARGLTGNETAILDLRFDPECSILTAADYAAANLSHLVQNGLVAADANDDDKARFMYLAHHDGLSGSMRWLKGQIGEDEAKQKLVAAAGATRANEAKTADKGWADTYLAWIFSKVRPDRFRT